MSEFSRSRPSSAKAHFDEDSRIRQVGPHAEVEAGFDRLLRWVEVDTLDVLPW